MSKDTVTDISFPNGPEHSFKAQLTEREEAMTDTSRTFAKRMDWILGAHDRFGGIQHSLTNALQGMQDREQGARALLKKLNPQMNNAQVDERARASSERRMNRQKEGIYDPFVSIHERVTSQLLGEEAKTPVSQKEHWNDCKKFLSNTPEFKWMIAQEMLCVYLEAAIKADTEDAYQKDMSDLTDELAKMAKNPDAPVWLKSMKAPEVIHAFLSSSGIGMLARFNFVGSGMDLSKYPRNHAFVAGLLGRMQTSARDSMNEGASRKDVFESMKLEKMINGDADRSSFRIVIDYHVIDVYGKANAIAALQNPKYKDLKIMMIHQRKDSDVRTMLGLMDDGDILTGKLRNDGRDIRIEGVVNSDDIVIREPAENVPTVKEILKEPMKYLEHDFQISMSSHKEPNIESVN